MTQDPKVDIIEEEFHPTDETFPQISKALLTRLEAIYVDCCPPLSMKEREIWFRCGQVDVIRNLRQEYERQREHSARR